MQNKPGIQKAKSSFFSPDEQSWLVARLSSALKCCWGAELDAIFSCSAQRGSLGQDMVLPWKSPPRQKSLTAIHRPLMWSINLFPTRSSCHPCHRLASSWQSSASFSWLLYCLLEPKTLTSNQEEERNRVEFRVFGAIYLKNVYY